MLDHALAYAAIGLHVFPLMPGEKTPFYGFKEWQIQATMDEDTIRKWWFGWPDANIGCHVGASGHVVLDIDVKGKFDGFASLAQLVKTHGPLPAGAWTAATPSGGVHMWFRLPDGVEAKNSGGRLGEGLDIKSRKGYVLLPPSRLENGLYRWLTAPNSLKITGL